MLSNLEIRCLELLEDLNIYLTKRVTAKEFMGIMGRIRDLRYALTNKKFGCYSGKHAAACKCERKVFKI